jgi:hypothetical protein
MFRRLLIGALGPTSELSGIQSNEDFSVSGGDAGVVNAADMPASSMNPPLPEQALAPGGAPSASPQSFSRLSVEEACAAIETRARRIVLRGL